MASNNATNTVPLTQDGQLLIGIAGDNPTANTLTAGAGITILNAPGSITISAGDGGFATVDAILANYTLAPSTQYITNRAGVVTYTLPAVAAVGDTYRIIGNTASGWVVSQNIGQTINVGDIPTTTGLAGQMASTLPSNCTTIVCTVANTTFTTYATQGILNVT